MFRTDWTTQQQSSPKQQIQQCSEPLIILSDTTELQSPERGVRKLE